LQSSCTCPFPTNAPVCLHDMIPRRDLCRPDVRRESKSSLSLSVMRQAVVAACARSVEYLTGVSSAKRVWSAGALKRGNQCVSAPSRLASTAPMISTHLLSIASPYVFTDRHRRGLRGGRREEAGGHHRRGLRLRPAPRGRQHHVLLQRDAGVLGVLQEDARAGGHLLYQVRSLSLHTAIPRDYLDDCVPSETARSRTLPPPTSR
jgi:hypothetical protein